MQTIFIEPFGGMAGDMFLAALLDLEDPRFTLDDLRGLAAALVPGECRVDCEEVWRDSLRGRHVTVTTAETENPPQRHYADLVALIAKAPLEEAGRERARKVLWELACAEGRVHGCSPEEIHFHEVGAVDTLVDVCGAAFALERLGVEQVRSSPPITGSGSVHCAHGEMPVPAPAVAELLRGRPHVLGGGGGERLTPTGAAILVAWTPDFASPGPVEVQRIGYGAGTRDPGEGPPNLMRVQLASAATRPTSQAAWLLECNLDDMTPQDIGAAVAALRANGALEVWTSAVQMKKDRPACVLSALSRGEQRAELEAVLFAHTTTLGVRWTALERTECVRSFLEVELDGQRVRVKRRERPGGGASLLECDLAPEYDDLVPAAKAWGCTLREARARVLRAALG